MGINVKTKPKGNTKEFPKIMCNSSTGTIVLFSEASIGTVLVSGSDDYPGYHFNRWSMTYFEDYNKPVTLENI